MHTPSLLKDNKMLAEKTITVLFICYYTVVLRAWLCFRTRGMANLPAASWVMMDLSVDETEKDNTKCSRPRNIALATREEVRGSQRTVEHSSRRCVV